jgi:putative addiction module component (TIGR02574 family)
MLTREEILTEALALPPADREVVAVALQDSLEDRTKAAETGSREFHEELRRRSAAYRSGQARHRSAAEVMAELFQMQADETAS